MKTFLLILFTGFTFTAFSQVTDIYGRKALENRKTLKDLPDSIKRLIQSEGMIMNPPHVRNSMPVLKFDSKRTLIGKNGKGADIYSMYPDNMPCIIPDSTFYSTMPVKKLSVKPNPSINSSPDLKLKNELLKKQSTIPRSN